METKHITKACQRCGELFEARTTRFIRPDGRANGWRCRVHYCLPCKSAVHSETAKRAVHPKNPPNYQCPICNTWLYRPPQHFRSKKVMLCSRSCYGEYKRQQMVGNTLSVGVKQTSERIAHRVSFIIGEKNPCWNGGITYQKGRGHKRYKYVKCPNNLQSMANNHGYIAEHRLVMARMLGRALTRQEVVHHANHDTLDNRPENLELFASNAEHKKHEGQSGYFKEYWDRIRTNRQNSPSPIDPLPAHQLSLL